MDHETHEITTGVDRAPFNQDAACPREESVRQWWQTERNGRLGLTELGALRELHERGHLSSQEMQQRVEKSMRWTSEMYGWLRAAGWFPGRDIGAEVAGCRQLAEAGWVVTPAAEAFLRQYALLNFGTDWRTWQLQVDGRLAAEENPAGDSWVDDYGQHLQHQLVPIGEQHIMYVMIDEIGGLWGGVGVDYGSLGSGIRDLFIHLAAPRGRGLDRRLPPEAMA